MSKARDLANIAGSNAFTAADETKLDGIETSADVTDATNVTAAGALMDSEVTNLAQVKAFDSADYATAAQGTTADAALPKAGGTMTGAITFAAGQTFDGRDVSADGSKLDGIESGATADQTASEILTAIKTVDGSGSGLDADTLDGQQGSYYYAASNPNGYTTFTANQSLDTTSSPTFSNPNLTSALRMGGTQVLSSGRALTNITSVDSTTAAAIGNAGVGGKTTLITDANISSGTSVVSINFTGGYKYYRVHITDGTHGAGGGSQFSYVARLTNSSGSTITGSATYNFAYRRISDSGGGSTNDADKFIIGDNSWVAGTKASLIIDIMDPYSTSLATMYYGFLQIGTNTQYSESSYMVEGHRTSGPERNNSMNIFFSTPYGTTTTNFTGGRLTVWGVNV